MGVKNGVDGGVDVTSNTLSVSKVPKNYEESKSFYDDRYSKEYMDDWDLKKRNSSFRDNSGIEPSKDWMRLRLRLWEWRVGRRH
jgi:hypothetical protein